jgi:predicted phage tail protein
MSDLIRGAGGGGKGGGKAYKPKTSPDGLDSTQYAQLIDLISEGEIQGLKDGLKSIFINNTPLQNADNSLNFQDIEVYTQNGTQDQAAIPLASAVENEVAVGVDLLSGLPIIRSITDPNVDAARITISVPQLQRFTSKGDIVGTGIRLQIAVQYAGGGFTTVIDDTITGRTADLYQRDYLVNFTGASPVDIKLTRITSDSLDPKIVSAFSWASYTEIIRARLRYPNSALIGMRVDAEQFSSIPQRAYLVRGIKVQIPNNATVDSATGALIYSGVWSGTFGAAQWCSDPAWILWDLLTSTRYGLGDHVKAAQLDKWSFYAASQYCSALNTRPSGSTNDYNTTTGRHGVPNGFGGYEPRFSCNVNIQTQEDAYKLINDMSSVFRAMPYWSTGALTISQDAPVDPAYLFTLANVTEEGFTYQSSGQKTRPTVAVVSYLDLATREIAYETVEDQTAIAKYGVVATQISAFACTSRGQASRMGEWLLYSEQYESEVISFTASIDAGVVVRPGQVIQVSDPLRAGSRRGGRITSATTTTVTVDDATGLTLGTSPQLSVILPNGTIETKAVSSIVGAVFTVSSAFSTAPNANSVWVYQTSDLLTSTWRVLGVQEQDGCMYQINALAYDASKYAYIERGAELQFRDTSNLNELPTPPTNLAITEALYKYQDEVRAKVVVSWKPVNGVNQYQVRWRKDSGNWASADRFGPDFEILNITPGYFEFQIYSVNAALKFSAAPLTGNINALGKTAPPSNVTSFAVVLDPDIGATLTWSPVADLDLQGYEIWQGPAFGVGTKIGLFAATAKKVGLMPTGTTTWYIKALDTSGVYSAAATGVSLTISGAAAPSVSGSFAGENFILAWNKVTGDLVTDFYEIRYGTVSSTWATATVLATSKSTAFSTKGNWLGTRRFFVAAVDVKGNVGVDGYFDAIVIAPTQPIISQQVIDNNVLLRWNDCTQTLPLDSYELRRGGTWAGGTVIGTKKGEFTTVFETTSGTYTYWLAGIDLAGNYGTPGSVAAVVNQPPDYVLDYDQDSTFSGTKTSTVAENGTLVATVSTTETWQDHFTSRGWTTLQDQITAGYPIYAQPSATSGSYVEEIDFGAVLGGTKITSTLTYAVVSGATTITPTLSVKTTAGGAWTDYAGVDSVYATNFRYVKVAYAFASSGGDDLIRISILNVKLDKKLKSDTGSGTANSGDVGGTTVLFNVPFVDIEGIGVTASGTTPRIAIYDFVDVPNPTSFKVLLFDTSGNRVTGGFSWQARGT